MSHLGLPMTSGPEEEDDRRRPRRRGRSLLAALVAVLALAVVVGGVSLAVGGVGARVRAFLSGPADYPGPGSGSVQVVVAPGDSATQIGQKLRTAGVVESVGAFVDAARADSRSTSIEPGYYDLKLRMKASEALAVLIDPANRIVTKVTIPEGLRLDETIKLLAQRTSFSTTELEAALKSPKLGLPSYAKGDAEGYLFPATYDVSPGDTALSLLQAMVHRFDQAAATVGLDTSARSPADVVIIASLVEAEARNPADYGKVARVITNRLAAGMPLQLDATINYALKADKTIITFNDLKVESSYNTYTHTGLPPGPIDSPGEAALQAAMNPTPGDWLYFVTVNPSTGETKFTNSYQQFLTFTQELRANGG